MHLPSSERKPGQPDDYLYGRGPAWVAFAMTLALMVFDYIDRQVIVSMFPHIKAAWGLSDKQLGALVSVVSITVALGTIPVALVADRYSRVKSIAIMAVVWSMASISCMFTRNYAQLLTARAVVGAGEAGYGAVGAALIASHFPSRLRSALLSGFFAAASIGSVLGVVLGGAIASRWGWQATFGIVGIPGFVLGLLYLKVRDYKTVQLDAARAKAVQTPGGVVQFIVKALTQSHTVLWVCIGGSSQLIVVSAVWSWMPSFLNRMHGLPAEQAAVKAAVIVLCGAVGSVVWGAFADRAGRVRPRAKLLVMAVIALSSMVILMGAFGAEHLGLTLSHQAQFLWIALGGFLMTCTVGPVSAVVIDVIHPGVRATGSSVLALFQNLFGLAAGPFLAGVLSDSLGLTTALTITPLFAVLAAFSFWRAASTYVADMGAVQQAIQ